MSSVIVNTMIIMCIPACRSQFTDAKFLSNITRQVGPVSKPQIPSNMKSLHPNSKSLKRLFYKRLALGLIIIRNYGTVLFFQLNVDSNQTIIDLGFGFTTV